VCRDLRIWVICAGFAFAALITLVIGRKMLREQFEHCRTEKRLEAREIDADEGAMAAYKLKRGAIGMGLPGVMHIFGSRLIQLTCDVGFSLTESPVFCEINIVKFYFVDFTSRFH